MYKLLVECPDGDQQIIEIDQSGGFFDASKILWDERTDGPIPNDIVPGKMVRLGKSLVKTNDYKPEYAQLKQRREEDSVNKKIADLWASADAYINSEINGVGLCLLSAGVQQQKPKALAVAAWCDSIWAEYYVRKGLITAENSVSNDFSSFGSKPYTVLELREEVASLWTGD
jgi:hypothetical protein